jgi:molybdopterin converting factor small subunit
MARLLYFATLVDRLEKSTEDLPLSPDFNTVKSLCEFLRARDGEWEKVFSDNTLNVTVNRQFANRDAAVDDKSEIAFMLARR